MSDSNEEPYSTIFTSLKHPIRRKILRMLSKNPMSFSEMLEVLQVSNSFLTYHLDNLGELVLKTDDGRYKLSNFGEAALATMTKVEDIPTTTLQQPPKTKPKRLEGRSVAIALGIICILLIAFIAYFSITGISAQNSYNNLQNQNKQLQTYLDENTTSLNQTQKWLVGNETLVNQTQANNTILQNQINSLSSKITSLQKQVNDLTVMLDTGSDATVYINPDGSVTPPFAPISSVDKVTYTFTGNISYPTYNGIVVERSNIVIDGKGYKVRGNQSGKGLDLTSISNVTIKNTSIEDFAEGIWLNYSSNNTVSGNNVTANSFDGIILSASSNNTVSGNTATGNNEGIWLYSSSNTIVSGNIVTANRDDGIVLVSSSNNNTVSGNNATANGYNGIWLYSSSNNVLSGNMMEDNGYNFDVGGNALSDFINSVDTSNLVNGKPIYFMTSKSNMVINPENYPDIGYLAFVNCTNMTVQGLTLTNEGQGILLAFTNDSKITNNNVTNCNAGINLVSSSNNNISGNYATANSNTGIGLDGSSNNTVSGNNATANLIGGIEIDSSSNNTFSGNNATANTYGIYLGSSSNNTVSGNNATANSDYGIWLHSSSNNIVSDNNATANSQEGIYLYSSSYNTVSGNIATANSLCGIYLVSSSNNKISGNNVTANGADGIGLNGSDNNTVSGNNVTANIHDGIDLYGSSNNTVSGNNVTANGRDGIDLYGYDSNNTVYHNNFIGNVAQAYVDSASVGNAWDGGYPSGGNYWSDYNGTDLHSGPYQNVTGSDGIGDTPYVIDANNTDHYPLMVSYVVPEFPSFLIPLPFMITTLLAVAFYRKKAIQ